MTAGSVTSDLGLATDILRIGRVLDELRECLARLARVAGGPLGHCELEQRIVLEDRCRVVLRQLLERRDGARQVMQIVAEHAAELELRVIEPDREVGAGAERDLACREQAAQSLYGV